MRRPTQSGFTLLELMVTIAMVGILASIVLPSFASTTRKAKAESEVPAIMGELRMRQEQYHFENGVYLSTGTSESNLFPATQSATPQALGTLPATWKSLKVQTPEGKAACGYVVIAGKANDTPGSIATATFGFVKPAKNWFYIVARCNMDNNTAVDAYYFTSSESQTIQKLNSGN